MIYKYRLRGKVRQQKRIKKRNFEYAMRRLFEAWARQAPLILKEQPILPKLINRDFICQNTKSE